MTHSLMKNRPVLLLAVLMGGLISGCGSSSDRLKTVAVSGKVLFEGQPVPTGSLLFVPVSPGPAGYGNLNPDGTFRAGTYDEADGLVAGEYQVSFQGSMTPPPAEGEVLLPEDVPLKPVGNLQTIPERYGDTRTSGLTATVKAEGPNDFRFELIP